jgi:polysaccharide biosynthesis/export protein
MNRMIALLNRTVCLAAFSALLFSSACFGPEKETGLPPLEEMQVNLELDRNTPPAVTLAPGDEIDIKFFYAPELNETQFVRPDGVVTLQLIGDVAVQGKTPAELREELRKLFVPHLRNPEVAVIVRSLIDRRVYVGGEVRSPGMIEMPGSLTTLGAIMHAGGFDLATAEVSNVIVIRHKNGKRYGCALNFDTALEGEIGNPFYLEPYDIVYVPETTIASVVRWIDSHINSVIPIGFRYTITSGDATIGLDTGRGGGR